MERTVACWIIWMVAVPALGQANLVRNAGFETDADQDGAPDEWRASGDQHVTQQLALDRGRDGSRCARLACTEFAAVTPASHVMLCQMGVPVQRGKTYRVTFWARGEGITGDMVSVALSDTSVWANCGLEGAFAPTPEWKPYEFIFRATRDCADKSRFQIWFSSTGTLWVDDMEFQEAGADLYHPGHIIPAQGVTNLVPNSSFECGTDGWGSAEWDRTAHWGGSMNRLFGQLDESRAYHGKSSLKIELSPENQPVSYFDYYDLHRTPIRAPLAANIGFVEVEPGRPYALSVYMKAAEADTPALLAVRQFQGRSFEKAVRVPTDWERHVLPFKPTSRWCYVLAGPDLRETQQNPNPPERARLWLDAVQLEQAQEPTPFGPRLPVEFGVWTDKPGNVFDWKEAIRATVTVCRDGDEAQPIRVTVFFKDFFDRESLDDLTRWNVPPGKRAESTFEFAPRPKRRGFLQLHVGMASGNQTQVKTLRMAVIPVCRSNDSRFGMNHAYPWPHLLDLCRKAGLIWMRDWSCKWQDVEPEKGRFTFEEADYQIDRPPKHGLNVLAMLPFPSAHWSSSAPADYKLTGGYMSRREHVAYPRVRLLLDG